MMNYQICEICIRARGFKVLHKTGTFMHKGYKALHKTGCFMHKVYMMLHKTWGGMHKSGQNHLPLGGARRPLERAERVAR